MSDSLEERGNRADWDARYLERGAESDRAPSQWVIRQCLTIRSHGLVLDVAGGTGRNAEPIAAHGYTVVVADFVQRAVAAAVVRQAHIFGVVAQVPALPFRFECFDAIVCVSFLDRSAFGLYANLLHPGGTLIYETFTRDHLDVVARGRARGPRNPEYLLEPGELPELVAPLVVQEHSEGLVVDGAGERHVARVMAVKR